MSSHSTRTLGPEVVENRSSTRTSALELQDERKRAQRSSHATRRSLGTRRNSAPSSRRPAICVGTEASRPETSRAIASAKAVTTSSSPTTPVATACGHKGQCGHQSDARDGGHGNLPSAAIEAPPLMATVTSMDRGRREGGLPYTTGSTWHRSNIGCRFSGCARRTPALLFVPRVSARFKVAEHGEDASVLVRGAVQS
jgi:hypothetical protein